MKKRLSCQALRNFSGSAIPSQKEQETESPATTASLIKKTFSAKLMVCSVTFMILFINTTVFAQNVQRFDEFLKGSTLDERAKIKNLLEEENTTIYLKNGTFETEGTSTPKIVSVSTGSSEQLYAKNPSFKNIELIKINLHKPEDAGELINLDRLVAFENLKFIYVFITYTICGETKNLACQKSVVQKFFPATEDNKNLTILFQTVTLQ